MSGGAFDYQQYRVREIWENIQTVINRNGKLIPKKDRWYNQDEEQYYEEYTTETIKELKEAVGILKKAEIYANRVDYLFSGDDREETFNERLKEELGKI